MKRFLSLFVMLVMTLGVMAQTQHMKFMGIPLNGTISAFHQKLVAKGCKHDVEVSKVAGVGSRAFTGTFFGEKSGIYVYYNAFLRTCQMVVCNFMHECAFYENKSVIFSSFSMIKRRCFSIPHA